MDGRLPDRKPPLARRIRIARALALWGGAALIAPSASGAQQLSVRVEEGSHSIADRIELAVVADGFDEDPLPRASFQQPDAGTLHYVGVTPTARTRIAVVDGERRRVRQVSFTYRFAYASSEAGGVVLPPFVITQGSTVRRTDPVELRLTDVPASSDLRLRLEAPSGRVFLGERVPVVLEFWIARELQEPLQSYSLRVPLFDLPGLRFVDDTTNTDTDLRVETVRGTLDLRGRSRKEVVEGRRFVVVTVRRTMVPRETGRIAAAPPLVVISRATKWRRDLFGSREATAVRKLKAVGEPVRFEVAEVPVAGRPESFAGAIGGQFTLEVSADRSVVQVGEPIVLSFVLSGDGDLSHAGLPPLDAAGLDDPARFRIPAESPAGKVQRDGKHFSAWVRVLDEDVAEIPPLEYAWFDARRARFETTRSRPIALAVREAQIVGASDVARRDSRAPPLGAAIPGADLWMERDVATVLRGDDERPASWMPAAGLYGFGLLLLASSVRQRQRPLIDPARRRRGEDIVDAKAEVERALALPARSAAGALARSLRRLRALMPDGPSDELDSLLGDLDARSYAPNGSADGSANQDVTLPADLCARARRVADELEGPGFR